MVSHDRASAPCRLLTEHTESVLPYIYTPTVGEACERYHTLPGLKPRGLYLSIKDKGHILEKLRAWPKQHVSTAPAAAKAHSANHIGAQASRQVLAVG